MYSAASTTWFILKLNINFTYSKIYSGNLTYDPVTFSSCRSAGPGKFPQRVFPFVVNLD